MAERGDGEGQVKGKVLPNLLKLSGGEEVKGKRQTFAPRAHARTHMRQMGKGFSPKPFTSSPAFCFQWLRRFAGLHRAFTLGQQQSRLPFAGTTPFAYAPQRRPPMRVVAFGDYGGSQTASHAPGEARSATSGDAGKIESYPLGKGRSREGSPSNRL
jgi:hypothetical protein